ncbi:MAG TPA: SurA N-terminal domain-containing protein [Candidatus Babeliales bacterium]|nr:SurA N-terminal domain-containing protein [Candidatus Babeliales bacterium]
MIITIRNQIKHSTFRYVAFFIVVVLGAGMISIPSLMRQERAGASWALQVNGEKVSYQEFAREIAEQSEFLAQVRAQYGQYADLLFQAMGWPSDPKSLAFDVLVKTTLMGQLVKELGISVHADYIAESINDAQFARRHLQRVLPPFIFEQTGALNPDKLKMFLQHKGISIKEFENKIEQSLAQLQAMQFVALSAYIPSFDIKQEFIVNNLGKQFSYLTFSFDSFLSAEKRNAISDEDARVFYDKENIQRRRYWVPEKRDGIVWKFGARNYNASISEEQISEYYEDNKASKYVLDPIKVEVRQITEKQLSQYPDVTLERVKEEIINDPNSSWAKKWELLKPFARGEKKGDFEKEAFLLQKEGEISSVIETKDGKVIVQLVRRIPRTYKPLSAVRSEMKTILAEKQFKKSFVKDIKAIVTQGDAQGIEAFIAQKTGKKEMALGVIKNDTRLSKEFFGLKKDEYGFFVEGETGFVVLLTNIAERNLPEFDSIKDVVKGDLYEERAYDAMISAVEEAKKAATQSSFDQLAKEFGASLHHTDMIQPNDSKKIQELDKKGLPAKAMLGFDKSGAIFVHSGERVSFLIKVDAIEEYDQNDLISAQTEILPHLESNRMKMQIESVVASLHRNATIETNELTQITEEEYSE